jgi:hypothetical protein
LKNTIIPIDYVTKDYDGFKQLMIDKISTLTPEWTDHSESDFGMVILEALAYCLHILSFYQDKAVNENLLSKARARKSVIDLCKFLGYDLYTQTPSQYKIVAVKDDSYVDEAVTILKGTKIGTDDTDGDSVSFELDSDLVIPAGKIGNEKDGNGNYLYYATATQGETVSDDIVGTGDGTSDQEFQLTYPDVILDTLEVTTTENGYEKTWTRVDNFIDSSPTDRHYTISVDEYNMMTLHFGNGVSGMATPTGAIITGYYRNGGGTIGNVGIGTINTFLEQDVVGIVSFSNPESAIIEGVDNESIDHAKATAPRVKASNDRAVTASDFEALALKCVGVARAKAIETYDANGDVNMYIAPTGFGVPTQALKDSVLAYLVARKSIQDTPVMYDVTYHSFDVTVNVITYSNMVNSTIQASVEQALAEALDISTFDFGDDVYVSSIFNAIMQVEGVRNVSITTPSADISVADTEIAKVGTITVTVTGGINA